MKKPNGTHKRQVLKNGRNKFEPYVKLRWNLLMTPAFRSLKPIPRAVYVELRRRFNGSNNGQIACSQRDLVKWVRCSKDSAGAALVELEQKGFIKCSQPGSFTYKIRHAPTWILTEEALGDAPATRDFVRWEPKETKPGPKRRTDRPGTRTEAPKSVAQNPETVLE